MEEQEFVDGWLMGHTLGEGAYGEVRLLLNRATGEPVAMKMVELTPEGDVEMMVRKEACIHRKLNHPNVVRFYGSRQEPRMHYIFLEYAAGGELFDRIEPDVGMDEGQAQKYFKQLLCGVEYMHSLGIAHRDLKPENLLLDAQDNLKISDFGMATMFRSKGTERLLEKRCGTPAYLAPEVLLRNYHAEPADVWACGIILVAMLAGELPWGRAEGTCKEFVAWRDGRWLALRPWCKLGTTALALAQRMLQPLPRSRARLLEAQQHRWLQQPRGPAPPTVEMTPPRPTKRLRSDADPDPETVSPLRAAARLCQSQPEPCLRPTPVLPDSTDTRHPVDHMSFSQPAQLDDLLLSSQLPPTQGAAATPSQSGYQRLVRRMTRFFVKLSCEESVRTLEALLGDRGWTCKTAGRQVTVSGMDRRKLPLTFKMAALDMDGQTLLDFRLSRGCGLEFKRYFVKVREALGDTVLKGPVAWPIAVATHTLP